MDIPLKQYLLTVFIGKPQPEHAKIRDVIQEISKGNFQIAHLHSTCISLLFSTRLVPGQITARLEGAVLNDDRRLLVEIGPGWDTFGLDKAASWLGKNFNSNK